MNFNVFVDQASIRDRRLIADFSFVSRPLLEVGVNSEGACNRVNTVSIYTAGNSRWSLTTSLFWPYLAHTRVCLHWQQPGCKGGPYFYWGIATYSSSEVQINTVMQMVFLDYPGHPLNRWTLLKRQQRPSMSIRLRRCH